jgi:hypothetical protein
LDAGDNPALKKVNEGSVNFVRGGKQSTNFLSGVSNKVLVNSYNADTSIKFSKNTNNNKSFFYLFPWFEIQLEQWYGQAYEYE